MPTDILVYHLLATGFITGVLDATTYADFGTFTSNQTGNTVVLGIGALGISPVRLVDVATSLVAFLVTTGVCGQCVTHFTTTTTDSAGGGGGGGRTRWWIILSASHQAVTVLVLPVLTYARVISIDGHWSWFILLLLASSAGAQVAMAKQFGIPEIPTAMLTSPFADVLCDPHLFSLSCRGAEVNVPRNRRMGYILLLVLGVFLGATMHRFVGTTPVLLLAGCLKVVVLLTVFFVPGQCLSPSPSPSTGGNDNDNDNGSAVTTRGGKSGKVKREDAQDGVIGDFLKTEESR